MDYKIKYYLCLHMSSPILDTSVLRCPGTINRDWNDGLHGKLRLSRSPVPKCVIKTPNCVSVREQYNLSCSRVYHVTSIITDNPKSIVICCHDMIKHWKCSRPLPWIFSVPFDACHVSGCLSIYVFHSIMTQFDHPLWDPQPVAGLGRLQLYNQRPFLQGGAP